MGSSEDNRACRCKEVLSEDDPVCRCEEVLKEEILTAIRAGATHVDHIKRLTRAGMGLCQGRTCTPAVAQILAQELKTAVKEVGLPSARPPIVPLPVSALKARAEEENIQPHTEKGLSALIATRLTESPKTAGQKGV